MTDSNVKYCSQVLIVGNVEETQQFYREKLGFTIEGQFVERGGASFLLKQADASNANAIRPSHQVGVPLDTYIWVNDVDVLYEEFVSAGVQIPCGYGVWHARFADQRQQRVQAVFRRSYCVGIEYLAEQ